MREKITVLPGGLSCFCSMHNISMTKERDQYMMQNKDKRYIRVFEVHSHITALHRVCYLHLKFKTNETCFIVKAYIVMNVFEKFN